MSLVGVEGEIGKNHADAKREGGEVPAPVAVAVAVAVAVVHYSSVAACVFLFDRVAANGEVCRYVWSPFETLGTMAAMRSGPTQKRVRKGT